MSHERYLELAQEFARLISSVGTQHAVAAFKAKFGNEANQFFTKQREEEAKLDELYG